jgi:hypothetical protein
MLKVRLMGTKEDIVKFWKFLQNAPELNVIDISDIFTNSGTERYYRCYTKVEFKNMVITHVTGKQVPDERH